MGRISHQTKLDIVRLHAQSYSNRDIKAALNSQGIKVSRQVVDYWVQQYTIGQFGSVASESSTKLKQLRKLSESDLNSIQETLSADPCTSSRDLFRKLKSSGSTISLATTKRAIKLAGFTNTKPRYAQLVRHTNKEKRVEFCRELLATDDHFEDVIFTDECSVQLHQNRVTFYRRINSARSSIPKPKHPLKLHLWAGISKRGATPVIIFDGIMTGQFFTEEILQNVLLPFIQRKFPDKHRFQMDNDPKHRSRVAQNFMTENSINWWNVWPSESADLNPIEMVWSQLKRHLSKKAMTTKEELVDNIKAFWSTYMTRGQCQAYIDHIYKVVPVCLLMNGQATGSMPDRIFRSREPSLGKSITYFNNLLWSSDYESVRKSIV